MSTSPINSIIVLEGIRDDVTFQFEEEIHQYMTGGPNRHFQLIVNLNYLFVYRNNQPGFKEYATKAFIIYEGVILTTYKPV